MEPFFNSFYAELLKYLSPVKLCVSMHNCGSGNEYVDNEILVCKRSKHFLDKFKDVCQIFRNLRHFKFVKWIFQIHEKIIEMMGRVNFGRK